MTVFDPLPRQGMPSDRTDRLDAGNLFAQGAEAARFVRSLADHEGISRDFPFRAEVYYDEEYWTGSKSYGHVARQEDVGDPLQASAVPGAANGFWPVTIS